MRRWPGCRFLRLRARSLFVTHGLCERTAGQGRRDLAAQEYLPDSRGGQHSGWLTVTDKSSTCQADQPAYHRGQRAYDMFDPDDGDAFGVDAPDDFDELGDLGISEPARYLVKQKQTRTGGKRPGQFKTLALQQAKPVGVHVGMRGHAGAVKCLHSGLIACLPPEPGPLLGATSRFSKTVISPKGRGT